MKFSIRGRLNNTEGADVVSVLQPYPAWRLIMDNDWDTNTFIFEIWVAEEDERATLFNDLKPFVDLCNGGIDWHECTHDQRVKEPCVIVEEYRR